MAQPTTIRDLREKKNLSQDKVAAAAGLTYSVFVRIEEGTGKTTPEEVKHVMKVLREMEPGTRKLAGRPFKDPEKQAAVQAARAEGKSVAEVLGITPPVKAPSSKKAAAPKKSTTSSVATALAKKAPARARSRKSQAGPKFLSNLLP